MWSKVAGQVIKFDKLEATKKWSRSEALSAEMCSIRYISHPFTITLSIGIIFVVIILITISIGIIIIIIISYSPHQSSFGFDQGAILSVHLVVKTCTSALMTS